MSNATLPANALPYETRVVPFENGYVGTVKVKDGAIMFYVREITHSRQSLEAVLEVGVHNKKGKLPPFIQRIDMRSNNAVKNLTTDLNNAYGGKRDTDGYNWSLILNAFISDLSVRIRDSQTPVDVGQAPFEEPSFLLRPFLQKESSNLLFAQSEVGKTWFALKMAVCLATGKPFMGHPCEPGTSTVYIDYEDSQSTFVARLHKLCKGMGVEFKDISHLIRYYKPMGSFKDNVEVIKSFVLRDNVNLLIIDAGGDAAGGSPSDEEKVLDLFNALEEVRATKLILHHEPKYVISEAAAFYGSMYWKARSRVAWRLEVEAQEASSTTVKASIQKRSNLPYYDPFYYEIKFDAMALDDYMAGDSVPAVTLEPVEVSKDGVDTDEMILAMLKQHGELDCKTISELVGKNRQYVNRLLIHGLKNRVETKWVGKQVFYKLKGV